MYTVIQTPSFLRSMAGIWTEQDAIEFIDWIADNPEAGDVIAATHGLRKIRWSRQGVGKRGGVRVIYLNHLARGEIALLMVYTKAKFDNLPTVFLNRLKESYHV